MKFYRINWERLKGNQRIRFSPELTEADKLIHDAVSTIYLNGIDNASMEEVWYCSEILKSLDSQFKEMFKKDPRTLMAEIELEGVEMKGAEKGEG